MVSESTSSASISGPKLGRAVIGQRYAVDDELGLILRASGMEDGVAFVEPAGLGVDQILQGAAGKRRGRSAMPVRPDDWWHRRCSGSSSVPPAVTFTAVLMAAMLSLTIYSVGRAERISIRL